MKTHFINLLCAGSLTLLFFVFLPATVFAEGVRIYVSPSGDDDSGGLNIESPLRTMEGAKQISRQMRDKGVAGEIEVEFAEGIYPLSSPVIFEVRDSLLTFKGNGRAVFCGGKRIDGWKRHRGTVWVASVPPGVDFRQLWVGGELRRRARTPNEGVFTVVGQPDDGTPEPKHYATPSDAFFYRPGDIDPGWKDPAQGEAIVYHYWTDSHLPISSIDGDTHTVHFRHPSTKRFTDGAEGDWGRYIIENVYEALDLPGEWMFDRKAGKLYYIPMPGEDMRTVEVTLPGTEQFIRISGDADAGEYVEGLRFEGLAFRYSNFVLKEGDGNDSQAANTVPACIELAMVRGCVFTDCVLRDLGTYAFELGAGCSGNIFSYNDIGNVGAGGFRIRGSAAGRSPLLRTHGNIISDNTIAHYGLYYSSAVGILLMHADSNEISHNLIHHGGYTGISVGWSWSYARSASFGNRVCYNHIHHIGTDDLLSDMGGIYTLGDSPGTVLRGNVIHDVSAKRYGGWGIYNDEGSTGIVVEDNIVYRTKFGMFNIHYARNMVVRNNIFALGELEQLSRTHAEPHISVFFEGNIVYWRDGILFASNWKDKPYKIYHNIFKGVVDADKTLLSDWNLFYNPRLSRDDVDLNGFTWEQWHAMGRDVNSLYADPLFVDPENGDFTLLPDSPALKMGFRPLDAKAAGPRPR
jgi:hypothetical protein